MVRTLLWIGTAIYITDLFPLTREWSRRIANILWMSLTSSVISIGESSYSVVNIIIILICLFFGLVAVAGAVTNLLRSRVLRITSISLCCYCFQLQSDFYRYICSAANLGLGHQFFGNSS
ncbi:MAG: hypothetical protein N2235_03815 [Fischerella sp.]|nr:hypothetical protein [Fischerella sp.]